jgi:AcrR family transcriptional regulator
MASDSWYSLENVHRLHVDTVNIMATDVDSVNIFREYGFVMKEKPYHHGDLRRALVDASIELIGATGPDGLTLREVARRAQVSHTAPYRHFRDKNDLLAAVAEQGFTDLRQALAEALAGVKNPLDRLRQSGAAYVNFALAHTAHFRVMFGAELDARQYPSARLAAEQAFQALVDVVAECQAARALSPGETRKKALIAWSLVHGIAHLAIGRQLALKGPTEIERFVTDATKALVDGLGSA